MLNHSEEKIEPPRRTYDRSKRRVFNYESGQRNECCACGEYFAKNSTFTNHRIGSFKHDTRRCMTVKEMLDKGFSKSQTDFWLSPVREENKGYFRRFK